MFIYFIVHDFGGPIKVGITQDLKKRLSTIQVGNPNEVRLMAWINSKDKETAKELESRIHKYWAGKKFRGEWYELNSEEVYDLIKNNFYYEGYLATNEDALEIVERDRDGVPILGGIWDWGDLGWEDCCPGCGSIMGAHYEEDVMAYNCFNCGIIDADDGDADD